MKTKLIATALVTAFALPVFAQTGAPAATASPTASAVQQVKKDNKEIRQDTKDIRADKAELARDRADLHHDRMERRHDRHKRNHDAADIK